MPSLQAFPAWIEVRWLPDPQAIACSDRISHASQKNQVNPALVMQLVEEPSKEISREVIKSMLAMACTLVAAVSNAFSKNPGPDDGIVGEQQIVIGHVRVSFRRGGDGDVVTGGFPISQG